MALQTTVDGWLRADGSLELPGKLDIPPGRVRVTVESLASSPDALSEFEKMTVELVAYAATHPPRTREEIDADLRAFRDEIETDFDRIEQLQESFPKEPNVVHETEDQRE